MTKRLLYIVALFFMWLPVFLIQKPVFMWYHLSDIQGAGVAEWFQVMLHGLTLDMVVAGYLTAVPLLAVILSVWLPGSWLKKTLRVYYIIASILVASLFAADLGLYGFWGFKLDSTVLFYLQSSFKDAMASVPLKEASLLILLTSVYAGMIYWLCNKLVLSRTPEKKPQKRVLTTTLLLFVGGLIFIPIRGGLTTATANVGMAYFSQNQFLNHAAVNPCFSFLYSIASEQDFASQFNFYPEEEREAIFRTLVPLANTEEVTSEETKQFDHERPNILLILLESFSYNAIEVLGGEAGVTPHLNQLAKEGILFDRFYANSFRTDRALPAILSGYTAPPTTSILKYPTRSAHLPSLAKSLIKAGYATDFLYGGDVNFANMGSYFHSSGYQRITSDKDFPLHKRLSKWGVNDETTFEWLYQSIQEKANSSSPWFYTFLTLSSHIPFDVPYQKLEDPYMNSVAYTDSCLGNFIQRIKETPEWDNLWVIIMADHGYRYMEGVSEYDNRRYHIPMVWTGGVIQKAEVVSTLANQNDFATTLLRQLGLPDDDFLFGKDIFNPQHPHYAFYTYKNGFAFMDNSGITIYDNDSESILKDDPTIGSETRLRNGKAILQTLYRDMDKRK
ncbi:sulfatase-like hydrolase/transferase [Parabacteroides sp. OttesenSCG-928-G06]|nr:sulfatase-like hydrolase/transferase [Parabacteroides sp. OttesenSCG-928-G06]